MERKAVVRSYPLALSGAGRQTLWAAELHGKRLDKSSQPQRVRDEDPVVHGTLVLGEVFEKHVAGTRMNKALKQPALHHIIQFPAFWNLCRRRTRAQG